MTNDTDSATNEHAKIVSRLHRQCAGEWIRLASDDYARRHLCGHLYGAKRFDLLFALVAGGNAWAKARYREEGSFAGYLADLNLAWTWAESADGWNVAYQLRCALIWGAIQDLEVGHSSNASWSDGYLLPRLVRHSPPEYATDALAMVRGLANESGKGSVLLALVPELPDALHIELLKGVQEIQDAQIKTHVLAGVLPHLDTAAKLEVGQVALQSALAIDDEEKRVATLDWLVEGLPDDLKGVVVSALFGVHDKELRIRALVELAPRLKASHIEQCTIEAARTLAGLEDQETRFNLLIELASNLIPNLPDAQKEFAITLAVSFMKDEFKLIALGIIAEYLPADLQERVVDTAITMAKTVENASTKAETFRSLLKLAPKSARLSQMIVAEAWNAARIIDDAERKVWVLTSLVPHLPSDIHPAAIQAALAAAQTLQDLRMRAFALLRVAVSAPDDKSHLSALALESAMSIDDDGLRANTLSTLARELPDDMRRYAIRSALGMVPTVKDTWVQQIILSNLASQLPDEWKADALRIARDIKAESDQAVAMNHLVPYLPMELKVEILAMARNFRDPLVKAKLLFILAGSWPEDSRHSVLGEALESTRFAQAGDDPMLDRSGLFRGIVDHWARISFAGLAEGVFASLVRDLIRRSQAERLDDVKVMVPLIEHQGGREAVGETLLAIRDVDQWWVLAD